MHMVEEGGCGGVNARLVDWEGGWLCEDLMDGVEGGRRWRGWEVVGRFGNM